jgi:hypothetical protein
MCAKPLKVSVEVRACCPSDSCGGKCVAAGESLGRPRHRPRVCRARTRRDAGVDDKTPGVCHVPCFACVGGALCRHWRATPSAIVIHNRNNRTLPYIGVLTVGRRRGAVRCRRCWPGSLRPQRQQLLRLAGMCRAARVARGARHRTVPLQVRAVVRLPGAVASVVRCPYCGAPCALIQPLCHLFACTHCASSLLRV